MLATHGWDPETDLQHERAFSILMTPSLHDVIFVKPSTACAGRSSLSRTVFHHVTHGTRAFHPYMHCRQPCDTIKKRACEMESSYRSVLICERYSTNNEHGVSRLYNTACEGPSLFAVTFQAIFSDRTANSVGQGALPRRRQWTCRGRSEQAAHHCLRKPSPAYRNQCPYRDRYEQVVQHCLRRDP